MREILFRGKRTDNGEWVFGMAWIFKEKTMICPWRKGMCKYDTGFYPVEVIPETFGQFTGLTDKNGMKIFEGDILEFSDRLVSVFWHVHLGCWDSNFLKFTNKENGREDMAPCRWDFRAKVIGNIHDNPELLGGD